MPENQNENTKPSDAKGVESSVLLAPTEFHRPTPPRLRRPCDASLHSALIALETQLGTIEAYNRLSDAAEKLKRKIDAGEAKDQHPSYRVSVSG